MTPTLHDVARLAGVSIKTVSNVVNGHPHVRPSTRDAVERAVAELGYTPNLTARNLRSGRTGAIALAVPDLALSYFAELAGMVIARAEERGVVVLVEQTGGERERERELLRSPRLGLTDGLILSPLGLDAADLAARPGSYPTVLLGERVFDAPLDHVTMRNAEAARAATSHLLASGRRRVAVLGAHEGAADGAAGLRLQGHRAALAAAGVPFDPALVVATRFWDRSGGADAVRDLVARGVEFDAVFGLNDTLALGAIRALQEARRRVPDDVAVVGFDDLDEARYSIPSLTTIDPGRRWIAQAAVDSLLERVGGASVGDSRVLSAEFVLRVRESAPGPTRG
ncbi:LacI family DNA-binding transcriptional regulator [Microbacterium sp. NPDC091382]|uniref:LacI family DNA-binding transcriptional regulator n=1 Tax=Microbacterium sp. NPDC091382 TaxID=3364210 RepID=UPI00381EFB78